ncbi:MAG: phage minor head protein [Methylotenera sp.]|nr:phage minor head protein [Methylotenera sp.]
MFELKSLPPKEAIEYFRQKGYLIGFAWEDVWQQEHQAAFTVAKAMQIDLLEDIRKAVDAALSDGTPFSDFRKQLKPILVQKGWWGKADMEDPQTGEIKNVQLGSTRRLKTIYDTNLRTAHSEGQWERIQNAKAAFPYLQYDGNNSEHPRLVHSSWDGMVLPADDPFWLSHMPVKEYGCKCRVRQMNAAMLERRGLKVSEAPVVPKVNYTNKRTGEVMQVPKGVHPSFNYPPGGRLANLPKYITDKLDAVNVALAASTLKSLLQGESFAQYFAAPKGLFPIGVISDDDAAAIGAKTHTVRLSAETMQKQLRVHPELAVEEYAFVQQAIERGIRIQDGNSLIYLLELDGYVTVVKTTGTGKAVFMTSFRRLSSDQVKRDREIKRLLNK